MLSDKNILTKEDFFKLIDKDNYYIFKKTSKGQFVLMSVEALDLLRSMEYDISIVVKFSRDNTVRPVKDYNVNLYLSPLKSDIDLLEKFNIKLKDISLYYRYI